MSGTPNPRLHNETEHEVDFLKSELALTLTFGVLAEMKYQVGNQASAESSIDHASEAYSTVFQFLSDPKLYNRLTDDGLLELTLEAERVRTRLKLIRQTEKRIESA